MNLAAACGWTLVRSVAMAVVAVPLCWWIRQVLAGTTARGRAWLWGLLLGPFFTPALVTGYGYANFSLSLIRHPGWNELLYALLNILRLLPVGVLVMWYAPPPPVSAEALYCARLALGPDAGGVARYIRLWPWLIRGPWRAAFPAAAVVFLLCFQEFEVASLMTVTSWTVWMFDAQVGGVMPGRLLRHVMLPCLCQLAVLVPLVMFAVRSQFVPATSHEQNIGVGFWKAAGVWLTGLLGVTLVTLIPLSIVSRGALVGMPSVLQNRQMLQEILVAGGFGVGAGLSSAVLAFWLLRRAQNDRSGRTLESARWSALVVSLPGLMGSLAISLALMGLLQLGPLIPVRDSIAPAVLALILFLMPRALCLQLLAEAAVPRSGLHLADLMARSPDSSSRQAAAELLWQLRQRKHVLAAGVLCLWGYFEFTPCYLLAPPGLATAPARLYNLMHYGRSLVLSAMVLLTILAPVAAFFLVAALRRPCLSWWTGVKSKERGR